ncbi:MAG: hypothetical protein HY553_00270 [Elusimicrobia bacterium]|nr:hypothetical protein [Elusimicrobiota bacterium]
MRTLALLVILSSTAFAEESLRMILKDARDAAASLPGVAARDASRLAFSPAQASGGDVPRDAEGWPLLYDELGQAAPYTRTPSARLLPHVDVSELNRRLAINGVPARIYQLVPEKAVANVPPSQFYAVVTRLGRFGAVPFDGRQPWSRIVALETVGPILVAENERGTVYVNLAGGIDHEHRYEPVAWIQKEPGRLKVWFGSVANPGTSRVVLGSVLLRAGISAGQRAAALERVDRIVGRVSPPGRPAYYTVDGSVFPSSPDLLGLTLSVGGGGFTLF